MLVPDGVIVVTLPEQIVGLETDNIETVGVTLTTIFCVAVLVHPVKALVPVTV